MALMLQLVKYTSEGAKGTLGSGFKTRSDAAVTMLSSIGAELKGYWFVGDGEWHIAALIEAPDSFTAAELTRTGFQLAASGAVEKVRVMMLAEPADVDAAQGIDYRAPGQ